MNRIYLATAGWVFWLLGFVCCAAAHDADDRVFGDLGDLRPKLRSQGVSLESFLDLDYGLNTHGGADRGKAVLGTYDLVIGLDTEKAGLWRGGVAAIDLLWAFGESVSEKVGDLQGADNRESPDTISVYQATLEQELWDEESTLLFGLHEHSTDFYRLEYASVLVNSSFGLGPEVAQAGASTYPATALGARLKIKTEELYALGAVYDGVPGSAGRTRGTYIQLREREGVFMACEVGLERPLDNPSAYGKAGIGGWYRSTGYPDVEGNDNNHGFYLVGERSLTQETDPAQGLGAFLQFGFVPNRPNEVRRYLGAGLVYTGLLRRRDQDRTAVGGTYAELSEDEWPDDYERSDAEMTLEVTHHFQVTEYFGLHPDLQYVVNPGGRTEVEDALLFIIRAHFAL